MARLLKPTPAHPVRLEVRDAKGKVSLLPTLHKNMTAAWDEMVKLQAKGLQVRPVVQTQLPAR
jgi:hypothetical protein